MESILLLLSLALAASALFISWKRPNELQNNYDRLLKQIDALWARVHETEKKLDETEERLAKTISENIRLQAVILWLRLLLKEHKIEIAELPEHLREKNVSRVQLNMNEGGVHVNARSVTARDLIGRDLKENTGDKE